MIVFDLRCGTAGHVFEAWFGSSADYADQRERGLIACPICGDVDIEKAVMAPNVAAKGNRREHGKVALAANPAEQARAALAALAQAQAVALERSDWVGRDFTDQARAMHLGDVAARAIHGEATIEQARELLDEGVEVAPLLFPVIAPEARN